MGVIGRKRTGGPEGETRRASTFTTKLATPQGEWSHQFKVVLERASSETYWLLEKTEPQPQQVDLGEIAIDEEFKGTDVWLWATKVYDVEGRCARDRGAGVRA